MQNQMRFFALFGGILAILATIGYFVKSCYNFTDIQSIEVVFLTSVLLFFIAVQVVFRKRIKEFNKAEDEKKNSSPK